jgi:hypothetical protein
VGRRKNSQQGGGAAPPYSPGEEPFSQDSSFSPGLPASAFSRQDTADFMATGGAYMPPEGGSGFMTPEYSAAMSKFHQRCSIDSPSSGASPARPYVMGCPVEGLVANLDGAAGTPPRSALFKSSPTSPKKSSPSKSPGAAAAAASAKAGKDPDGLERTEPVTLNLIVREELNPAPNCLVRKGDIANAVELTGRPINKRAVYRDLETILAHEIHLGYVIKHADNAFSLPDIGKGGRTYRGTIPLKSSKRKPKPTQKYLESTQKYLEMEKELARFRQDNKFSGLVRMEPGISHFELPYPNGTGVSSSSSTGSPLDGANSHVKTEDELKDDLIKEKLISNNLLKMKSKKMKSSKVKVRKGDDPLTAAGSTASNIIEEAVSSLSDRIIKQEAADSSADEKPRSPSTKKLRLLKKETWHLSDTAKGSDPAAVRSEQQEKRDATTTAAAVVGGCETAKNSLISVTTKLEPVENIKQELEDDCGEEEEPAKEPPAPAVEFTAPTRSAASASNKERLKRSASKMVGSGKKTKGEKRKLVEEGDSEEESPAAPLTAPLTRTLSGRKKVESPCLNMHLMRIRIQHFWLNTDPDPGF